MNQQFVSLVVATKDRPADLGRMLDSLATQTRKPDEIVVVDSSARSVESVAAGFTTLNIKYQHHLPPSASAQRNAGIKLADSRATLIGFADDDTMFEADAFEKMLAFWDRSANDLLGAAFNILNYELPRGQRFKRSFLIDKLGLYASVPGAVAPSGWQSIFGRMSSSSYVEWLPTTAALWRRDLVQTEPFDEYFNGYSYLEDLDFSFAISKRGKLAVVADAGYRHFPSQHGRISQRNFGRVEVRNRLYFVQKHNLSLVRCCCCIFIRSLMTLCEGMKGGGRASFARLQGNLEALVSQAKM